MTYQQKNYLGGRVVLKAGMPESRKAGMPECQNAGNQDPEILKPGMTFRGDERAK